MKRLRMPKSTPPWRRSSSPLALLAALLLTSSLLGACGGDSAPVHSGEAPTPGNGDEPNAAASTQGTPIDPISSRQSQGQAPDGQAVQAPGATFQLPADWQREQPRSSMRLAQAIVPGEGGPAQLAVFHFGAGGGGGVEANLQRWADQVETAAGSTPLRDTFTSGPFQVTWIEVQGTIKPSTMGTGPTEPQPNSRLLAAVVEGDQGPWFFKLTGPEDTVVASRAAFIDMLKSMTPV